jgi:hypothetical protein
MGREVSDWERVVRRHEPADDGVLGFPRFHAHWNRYHEVVWNIISIAGIIESAHPQRQYSRTFPRMGYHYRPLLEVFREALKTLQNEPGPMIPAKVELMEYLRARIAEHESLNRATALS